MHFHLIRTNLRDENHRAQRRRSLALLTVLFITLVSLSHLGTSTAFAIPPEPIVAGLAQKDSTAAGDVADSGNANPDSAFRYDGALNGCISI